MFIRGDMTNVHHIKPKIYVKPKRLEEPINTK